MSMEGLSEVSKEDGKICTDMLSREEEHGAECLLRPEHGLDSLIGFKVLTEPDD